MNKPNQPNNLGALKLCTSTFCELHPDIDASFQPFLSDENKGSSDSLSLADSKASGSSKKDNATFQYMEKSLENAKNIMQFLDRTAEIREEERDIRRDERDIQRDQRDMKRKELLLMEKKLLQESMNQVLQNYMNPACPQAIKESLLEQYKSMENEYKSL